jgi:hypothetical protein
MLLFFVVTPPPPKTKKMPGKWLLNTGNRFRIYTLPVCMILIILSSTKYLNVIFQWPSGPYNKNFQNISLPNLSQYSNVTGRGGRRHKQLLGDLKWKERTLEIEIGRTRLYCVQNWPWKRLWACRKTDYWINSLHIQSSSRNRQILGSSKLASKTNPGNASGQHCCEAERVCLW